MDIERRNSICLDDNEAVNLIGLKESTCTDLNPSDETGKTLKRNVSIKLSKISGNLSQIFPRWFMNQKIYCVSLR